ncbi:hypothetical protein [Sphingomonas sp. M1A8_2b]
MAKTDQKRNRRQVMKGGMILWAVLVSLFFLWQVVQYNGVMALLAEWQFGHIGHYYPSLTYLALVVLLVSPGLLIFLNARKRGSDQRLAATTLRSATVFRRTVLGLAAACFAAAITTLLLLFTLPSGVGTPRRIDLARPVLALPSEGPTTINGMILYNRTAAFDQDRFVARRTLRFAPIIAPRSTSLDLQFFVELPSETASQVDGVSSLTGLLKRNALPGEIVRLFRYAGYRVEPPHYVLFASNAAMRWPYFEIAAELGFVALIFLAIGLWQHHRVKRLEDAIKLPVVAPPLATA